MNELIIEHFIETLDQIIDSPRWKDPDTPGPNGVNELVTRIIDGETYLSYRKTEEFQLVIDVIESFETSLNDDWMPYQIEGLNLKVALGFAVGVRDVLKQNEPIKYPEEIVALHEKIRTNNG